MSESERKRMADDEVPSLTKRSATTENTVCSMFPLIQLNSCFMALYRMVV